MPDDLGGRLSIISRCMVIRSLILTHLFHVQEVEKSALRDCLVLGGLFVSVARRYGKAVEAAAFGAWLGTVEA